MNSSLASILQIHILYIPFTTMPTYVCPMLCYPLVIITWYVLFHCNESEDISFSAEQRPPDPNDWDVESESSAIAEQHEWQEQDEDRLGAESDSINGEDPEEPEVAPFIIEDNVNGDATPRYGSINNQMQVKH